MRTYRALVALRDEAHLTVQRDDRRVMFRRDIGEARALFLLAALRLGRLLLLQIHFILHVLALDGVQTEPLVLKAPNQGVWVAHGRIEQLHLAVQVLLERHGDKRVGGARSTAQGRHHDAQGFVVELVADVDFSGLFYNDREVAHRRCAC